MKHKHVLTINKVSKSNKKYVYDFGNTKNVEIIISANGIQIVAELNKLYDKNEMISGNVYLFPDAIRKGLLIYLLTYSKGLTIKTVNISIDNEKDELVFNNEPNPPIYSMVNDKLVRSFSLEFTKKPIIDYILNTPKSGYDRMTSALFSFITSKSKLFETERFIYLWTTFNAMYGFYSKLVRQNLNEKEAKAYNIECNQIKAFQQMIGVGSATILKKESRRIANDVIFVLKTYEGNISKKAFENKKLSINIESKLTNDDGKKYDLSAYGYLLTQFSYYYRCNIIHGSKPIILFTYSDDTELHCLKIINGLLEEFIDEHLPKFFDPDYINNTLIPSTKSIVLQQQEK